MAILFNTVPVVHPVYHVLVATEEAGGWNLVYSRFKDDKFSWKAVLRLDSIAIQDLRREIDFLEKANTFLLGSPDFVDPMARIYCEMGRGTDKAKTDSAFQFIRARCVSSSRSGVILEKGRRAPVYFYGFRSLISDSDRRSLEDLRIKSIEAILKALPGGEITWKSSRD